MCFPTGLLGASAFSHRLWNKLCFSDGIVSTAVQPGVDLAFPVLSVKPEIKTPSTEILGLSQSHPTDCSVLGMFEWALIAN